jgi:hypothetical protein
VPGNIPEYRLNLIGSADIGEFKKCFSVGHGIVQIE